MGRKSLAHERAEQILDAFERCIIKHGFEASSLEKIAEEAGVKRSLIRHYLGNRDDLTEALIKRILKHEADLTKEAHEHLSPKDLKKGLLNYLFFDYLDAKSKHIEILLKALWKSVDQDKRIKALLQNLYQQGELEIKETLELIYPNASKKNLSNVAYGLLCLSEGVDNTQMLGFDPKKAKGIKSLAETLLKTLE